MNPATPIYSASPEARQHVEALIQYRMRHIQRLNETLAKLPRIEWHEAESTVHIPETEDFAGHDITIGGADKQSAQWLAAYIAAANPVAVGDILDELENIKGAFDMMRGDYVRAAKQLCNIGLYAKDAIEHAAAVPDALREIYRMAFDWPNNEEGCRGADFLEGIRKEKP